MEQAKGCPKCTSWRHKPRDCRMRRPLPCRKLVGNEECDRQHHVSLHDSKNAYCSANSVVNVSVNAKGQMILLGVQEVAVKESTTGTILFFDSGSTLTLCTHKWARANGLRGEPVTIFIKVLGEEYRPVDTCQYRFVVLGTDGKEYEMLAVGLEKLTREAEGGDLEIAYAQFPHIPKHRITRPSGDVDVLVGQDFAGYLPRVAEVREHLLLLTSKFGTGLLLSGRTGISGEDVCQHVLTSEAIDFGTGTRAPPSHAVVNFTAARIPTFMEAEDLVLNSPEMCGLHRETQHKCPDCRFRGEKISPQEKIAVEQMEASITRLPSGKLRVNYPFNDRAYLQESNINQAKAVQTRVEKTLRSKGIETEYHEEMRKAMDTGAIRKLASEEISRWSGPVHYVTLFGQPRRE